MNDTARTPALRSALPLLHLPVVQQWTLTSVSDLAALRASLRYEVDRAVARPGPVLLDSVPEHIALVATELATNGLVHGEAPVVVHLRTDGVTYLLDVANPATADRPHVAEPRPAGHGGFGLHITHLLSQDTAWYRTPDTVHVWATFTLPIETLPMSHGAL
ncbi:ATP-binding protein [Cellulomonas endophytica]|uniref:ATP-binding protein n=1 Tax=Cellulomonas endophytica TaxID=2494735 RepID=UPI001013A649|nr:ATP-binding protein [Cellulomonas endophytica]